MAQCSATAARTGQPCKRTAGDDGMCSQHSPLKKKCVHRSRRTGEPCGNYALTAQTQCRVHGGATANKRAAAKRRIAQQKAAKLLEDLGTDIAPVEDPIAELQRIAGRMKALQDLLWAELHPKTDGERPDPYAVEVFQDAADRTAKQLADLQKLGLFEVQVRVEATKAQLLATALQHVLRDLDLSPHQRALAPGLIRQHLLALPVEPEELPPPL